MKKQNLRPMLPGTEDIRVATRLAQAMPAPLEALYGALPLRLVAGRKENGNAAPSPPVRTAHRLSEDSDARLFPIAVLLMWHHYTAYGRVLQVKFTLRALQGMLPGGEAESFGEKEGDEGIAPTPLIRIIM